MFASIRRHQKWLFFLIMGAVILSFVVFFTPDVESHFRSGGEKRTYGSINGRPISSEEAQAAYLEARLRYFLYSGTRAWPEDDPAARQFFNQDRETQTRLFLLEKIREFGIQTSDKAATEWVKNTFRDSTGVFRYESFEQFVKQALQPRGYTLPNIFMFAQHEAALQHLVSVAGISGALIPPQEAERLYREESELIATEAVFFSLSNYLATVTMNTNAIAQFYTNQMARYRVPERTVVSYVQFDATNHLAEADQRLAGETNLIATIEAVYRQRGTNYYVDATNQPLSPAAARERIKEEIRTGQALLLARRLASEFADQLFELHEKQPGLPDQFDRHAAAKGYSVKVSEPFDDSGPADESLPPTFVRASMTLTTPEPFSSPVVGTNAVFVLALKGKVASQVPSFETIQDRVSEDYRRSQALEVARLTGNNFYNTVTNGLAAGKTFDAISAEAKLTPVSLPAIAASTKSAPEIENWVNLAQFKQAVERLGAGTASRFIATRDGGFVAHVKSRQPADPAITKTELPAFVARLRQERQFEAFNEWFRKERERASLKFDVSPSSGN